MSTASGNLRPVGIVIRAANLLRDNTVSIANTYFGSLEVAERLMARCPTHPFLFLLKRSTLNVKTLGGRLSHAALVRLWTLSRILPYSSTRVQRWGAIPQGLLHW